MLMLVHLVGPEIVRHLGEQERGFGLAAGAAQARLGVHDEPVILHQTRLEQRQAPQEDARGVATGIGDQASLPDVVPAKLAQAVGRAPAVEQLRMRVLELIPARIEGRIVEPEIAAEVDHALADAQQVRRQGHRLAVGQREKDHVARGGEFGRIEGLNGKIYAPPKAGKDFRGRGRALPLGRGGQVGKLDMRMLKEPPDELFARIPGRSGNRDPNR